MKRKRELQEPDGMQLRSGKVLPSRISTLPEKISDILETRLQKFKELFSDNPQHAKELLKIISKAQNPEIRFDITKKVEEVYDRNNPSKINPLLGAAGDVSRVLIYNPQYRDLIKIKINNFDLETPILGSDEPLTEEL